MDLVWITPALAMRCIMYGCWHGVGRTEENAIGAEWKSSLNVLHGTLQVPTRMLCFTGNIPGLWGCEHPKMITCRELGCLVLATSLEGRLFYSCNRSHTNEISKQLRTKIRLDGLLYRLRVLCWSPVCFFPRWSGLSSLETVLIW